jgi:magnesium chelatase family protein
LAVSLLTATGQVPSPGDREVWACGELGLDGGVRGVADVLAITRGAAELGASQLLVPRVGAGDAALVAGVETIGVADIDEVVAVLRGQRRPPAVPPSPTAPHRRVGDLAEVRGQPVARRAVEIAAAGGHHLLLSGPPGCGKTMLAHRLRGVLPPLDADTAIEVATLHALAGERRPDEPVSLAPPLREPHHRATVAALVGGGSGIPHPGEVSLAHGGILLVDELLEVPRPTLDALRQPLERGEIVLTRARARVRYPAATQLLAATNPCPCGYLGSRRRECRCRPDQVARYRSRLSGPLADRLDLQVELREVDRERLTGAPDGDASDVVAGRVSAARELACRRWGSRRLNRDVDGEVVRRTTSTSALRRLTAAVEVVGGSARAFDRALRVARTIADLDGADVVDDAHVDEAVAYRLTTSSVDR